MQALGLLCEMVREEDVVKPKRKTRASLSGRWKNMDETSLESFSKLCTEIIKIIDNSDDGSDSLKLAAVSALEVLANRIASDMSIFTKCLASVTSHITVENQAISSACLRTTGALVNVLGTKALAELPCIMENVIKISRGFLLPSEPSAVKALDGTSKESIGTSVLFVLEALVDKLGGFLKRHDIAYVMSVMVLNPDYASDADQKVKSKADTVRKLVTEKIPVRTLIRFPSRLSETFYPLILFLYLISFINFHLYRSDTLSHLC